MTIRGAVTGRACFDIHGGTVLKKAGCDGYSEFRVQFKMFLKRKREQRKLTSDDNIDEVIHFPYGYIYGI